MVEKRKHKRLELRVTLQLEAIDEATNTSKESEIEVTDISSSGIGFDSVEKLEHGKYYNTQMEIWTKEIIPCVIQIVREVEDEGKNHYGGVFIGMNDIDKRKIYIYQLIEELENGK